MVQDGTLSSEVWVQVQVQGWSLCCVLAQDTLL